MSARAVIKHSVLKQDYQEYAINVAFEAIAKCNSEQEIAGYIKNAFEARSSQTWHCFVGRNFATYVTYESSSFIYFYIGQVGICLFATD